MANSGLANAKNAKNDEFYTQYYDIEKDIYISIRDEIFGGSDRVKLLSIGYYNLIVKDEDQNYTLYVDFNEIHSILDQIIVLELLMDLMLLFLLR